MDLRAMQEQEVIKDPRVMLEMLEEMDMLDQTANNLR